MFANTASYTRSSGETSYLLERTKRTSGSYADQHSGIWPAPKPMSVSTLPGIIFKTLRLGQHSSRQKCSVNGRATYDDADVTSSGNTWLPGGARLAINRSRGSTPGRRIARQQPWARRSHACAQRLWGYDRVALQKIGWFDRIYTSVILSK